MAPLALALPLVCLRSLISLSFALVGGGVGRRYWNEFAVKMGKNEHYGLAEQYKVKVTLSPHPRLLPLFSFPSSSPSPLPFSGAFAGRWCHKSFVRSHLGLQAAMVLTAHGADDFQRGGSKGGAAISRHMKTSVGVGAGNWEGNCSHHMSSFAEGFFFSIGCMLCMRLHTKQVCLVLIVVIEV